MSQLIRRHYGASLLDQHTEEHIAKGEIIMPTNTIRLHRVLRATPERVYRAFLDADAMAKWLPPNGFTGKVHHLDAKVGGTSKMSFTNLPQTKANLLVENTSS